ncbi:hypothetical protein V2O64_20735 [Verrucomicrobiaceae bacterium 227]
MLIFISWFLLVIGLGFFAWFFAIRGRGSLKYWIRRFEVPEHAVLGQTFKIDDKAGQQQFFTDANAVVRSLDRRTNKVIRQWDREAGTVFLGLVMNALPDEPVPKDYELREFPKRQVVRLSGANRSEEIKEVEAVKAFAKEAGLTLDFEHPARLSGQSFGLYQWDVSGDGPEQENSLIGRWAESTYQLRNNLVLPLLATWIALALIGTAQPLLLVLGIVLICFLSGACKFVFIHQMTDEADEIHLQNY